MSALDDVELGRLLAAGTRELGLPGDAAPRQACLKFIALLVEWNRAYNLTATRDPREILKHHVLDSLSIAPHLYGKRILDIGTGAGLPGIPLAILLPGTEFHLLDSNGKKMRFLFQVKETLRLSNVMLYQQRVERFRDEHGFDCIVSRAFARLADMLRASDHLCAENGCFLAMKAKLQQAEVNEVVAPYTVRETIVLQVPGINATRHLLRITRNSGIPQKSARIS